MQGTLWLREEDLRALPQPFTEGLPHLLLEKVKIAQIGKCITQSELAKTAGLASAWRKSFFLGKGERSGEHCQGVTRSGVTSGNRAFMCPQMKLLALRVLLITEPIRLERASKTIKSIC